MTSYERAERLYEVIKKEFVRDFDSSVELYDNSIDYQDQSGSICVDFETNRVGHIAEMEGRTKKEILDSYFSEEVVDIEFYKSDYGIKMFSIIYEFKNLKDMYYFLRDRWCGFGYPKEIKKIFGVRN